MKQKTNRIISLALVALFLMVFFLKIIPVPIPDITTGNYIPVNFYWTSLSHELYVQNYAGVGIFSFMFVGLFIGNKFLYKKE